MISPSDPSVRPPARAGQFYPADANQCRAQAASFLRFNQMDAAEKKWFGGVVPHAGWTFSGAIAGETIATIAAAVGQVDVVVVFGAIHTPIRVDRAALDSHSRWALPGGMSQLPVEIESKLAEASQYFLVEPRLHAQEHAVEVEVPLLQLAFASATILPIEVPVEDNAAEIGRATVRQLNASGAKAIYLASSDFTHYGPNYRFAPAGVGPAAMQWAKDNDRRLLNVIVNMQEEKVISEVRQRLNACGAGAIVAMLAACKELGAASARLLTHATSFETAAKVAPQPPTHAVGYASIVVG